MKSYIVICLLSLSLLNHNVDNSSLNITENQDTVSILYSSESNQTTLQPRADILEWRYKMSNGKMYKRLYNRTKNQWVGDWILMK